MMKTKKRLIKYFWISILFVGTLAVLFGARSVRALYSMYDKERPVRNGEFQCTVPAGQTVVEWKSMNQRYCRYSLGGICVWPFHHKHLTYKVTVNEGVPLRNRFGKVIAATNGETKSNWTTYDSTSWNAMENYPYRKNRYTDFEPIASNEYVVMVQTRYRLFADVESTLGICIQQ